MLIDIGNIDFELLRRQKTFLLSLTTRETEDGLIMGIVHVLDVIQDEALATGYASELEIYGYIPSDKDTKSNEDVLAELCQIIQITNRATPTLLLHPVKYHNAQGRQFVDECLPGEADAWGIYYGFLNTPSVWIADRDTQEKAEQLIRFLKEKLCLGN